MRVRFGPFVFDSDTRELLEMAQPRHLSPKAFDMLEVLLERSPGAVTKAELLRAVWPDTFVEEANVANLIAEIRRALGDDPQAPEYVCTIPRRGYRFCGEVEIVTTPRTGREQPELRWWLTWKDTTLPLAEGENTIGRAAAVRITGTSVSREHARIVIEDGRATIEDRGSRNGTYVDGRRIAGRHPLVDGSALLFGSEKVTFRQWSDETATMKTDPISFER